MGLAVVEGEEERLMSASMSPADAMLQSTFTVASRSRCGEYLVQQLFGIGGPLDSVASASEQRFAY